MIFLGVSTLSRRGQAVPRTARLVAMRSPHWPASAVRLSDQNPSEEVHPLGNAYIAVLEL